ncbi:hypothetical protein [Serratia phage SP1]|nr:hypothetical protein [Serratia phage SP1]
MSNDIPLDSVTDVEEAVLLDTCKFVKINVGRETVQDDLGIAYQDFCYAVSYNGKTKKFDLTFNYSKLHSDICAWVLNEESKVQ